MPFAFPAPEFLTSRRHLAAAGVGLAVIAALSTSAAFARGPAVASPVAAAPAVGLVAVGAGGDDVSGDLLPSAVATPTATTTVAVAAPTVAPTPDGPAITALAEQGIPIVALQAYQNAARVEVAERPTCRIGWTLVAAIGAIESGHGTHGGARLYADGQDLPHVIGPVLDGTAGNARIADTDQGVLDGDKVYDRAVGPMQFIPSTWAQHGRDANGDGRADPFNIIDAATTADYLCAGGGDLSTEAGRKAAVFSYNHLDSYVATVLALEAAYAGRPVTTTSPSPPAPPRTPAPTSSSQAPRPSPTPSRTTTVPATPTPTPTCPTTSPTAGASPTPTGSPTATPTGCPTTSAPAPSSSAPAPSATPTPTG